MLAADPRGVLCSSGGRPVDLINKEVTYLVFHFSIFCCSNFFFLPFLPLECSGDSLVLYIFFIIYIPFVLETLFRLVKI